MGNFFIKLFVKDYRNTSDPKVRERYGKFAGVVGIVSNLLLCMIKILAGVFSASIAIIAITTSSSINVNFCFMVPPLVMKSVRNGGR